MLGHVLADAGELSKFLDVLSDVLDALVETEKQIRNLFIAPIASDNGAIDLKELSRFAQDECYFPIFHLASLTYPTNYSDCDGRRRA